MCAEELVYLRARATRPVKVALISTQQAAAYWDPEKSASAYPTRDSYLADVVDFTRREVDELIRLGCDLHPDRRAAVRGAARSRAARGLPPARQRSRPADRRVHRDGQRRGRPAIPASPSACTSAAATTSRSSTRAATTRRSRGSSAGAASSASCWSTTTSAPGGFEPLRAVPDGPRGGARPGDQQEAAAGVGGRAARRIAEAARLDPARAAGAEPAVRLRLDARGQPRSHPTSSDRSSSAWPRRPASSGARDPSPAVIPNAGRRTLMTTAHAAGAGAHRTGTGARAGPVDQGRRGRCRSPAAMAPAARRSAPATRSPSSRSTPPAA